MTELSPRRFQSSGDSGYRRPGILTLPTHCQLSARNAGIVLDKHAYMVLVRTCRRRLQNTRHEVDGRIRTHAADYSYKPVFYRHQRAANQECGGQFTPPALRGYGFECAGILT